MKYKGFRVKIIVIAALLAFALFLTGQFFYQRYLVLAPLLQELGASEGVEGIQVLEGEKGKIFAVQLAEVDDLAVIYKEIDDKLREQWGNEGYEIILRDNRNKDLTDLYQRVHFAVYEAIATGNFVDLAEKIEEEANRSGIEDYRVTVDGERIYLQFERDGSYFYEVVPRLTEGERRGIGVD